MSLEELKILPGDIGAHGVVAAPDTLTGTAQENKSLFDRLIRDCVGEKFNGLIDYLMSRGGEDEYVLPPATADTLGGVKIGSGLSVDGSGLISVAGGEDLSEQLETLEGEIRSMNADIADINTDIADLNGDIANLNADIGNIAAALDAVNGEVI